MTLKDSVTAAQAAQAAIDRALEPAQHAWDQLDWAKRQLEGLQRQAEADAARFRKAVEDAAEAARKEAERIAEAARKEAERAAKAAKEAAAAAADVAPVVAAYARFLVEHVGPLNKRIADWVLGGSQWEDGNNTWRRCDDVGYLVNDRYDRSSGAARATLDKIRAGLETAHHTATRLDDIRKENAWNWKFKVGEEAIKRGLPEVV